jgi:hypothetical protein
LFNEPSKVESFGLHFSRKYGFLRHRLTPKSRSIVEAVSKVKVERSLETHSRQANICKALKFNKKCKVNTSSCSFF